MITSTMCKWNDFDRWTGLDRFLSRLEIMMKISKMMMKEQQLRMIRRWINVRALEQVAIPSLRLNALVRIQKWTILMNDGKINVLSFSLILLSWAEVDWTRWSFYFSVGWTPITSHSSSLSWSFLLLSLSLGLSVSFFCTIICCFFFYYLFISSSHAISDTRSVQWYHLFVNEQKREILQK